MSQTITTHLTPPCTTTHLYRETIVAAYRAEKQCRIGLREKLLLVAQHINDAMKKGEQ